MPQRLQLAIRGQTPLSHVEVTLERLGAQDRETGRRRNRRVSFTLYSSELSVLADNLNAGNPLGVQITAEDEVFIDTLVAPGHSSTPGFNDVSHFVSGRIARP